MKNLYTLSEWDLEVIDKVFNSCMANDDPNPAAAHKMTELRDKFRKAKKVGLEFEKED